MLSLCIGTKFGSASAFSPLSIAGLRVWLDATRITGLNDGDSVASWNDLTGNGFHATQGTASKRPTYQTGEVNGKPLVVWDGVDDYLGISITQAQPCTVVFLTRVDTINNGRFHDGHATDTLVSYAQAVTNRYLAYAGAVLLSGAAAFTAGVPARCVEVWNGASSSLMVDGATVASGNAGAGGVTELVLGIYGNKSAGVLTGGFGEFMVYNRVLDATEIAQLNAYLTGKWTP